MTLLTRTLHWLLWGWWLPSPIDPLSDRNNITVTNAHIASFPGSPRQKIYGGLELGLGVRGEPGNEAMAHICLPRQSVCQRCFRVTHGQKVLQTPK